LLLLSRFPINTKMSQPNATSTTEKRTSEKDLDLTNNHRGVWLVKVPKYIADRWESAEPHATVGTVKLIKRTGGKSDITFKLDDKIVAARPDIIPGQNVSLNNNNTKAMPSGIAKISTTQQQIPKDHKFVVSTMSSQHLAVFSHTAGTGPSINTLTLASLPPCPTKLRLEGAVAQRAECKPVSNTDEMYMKLKREALLKPVTLSRKTVHLNRVVNSYKPVAKHVSNIKYEQKKKAVGKMSRDDRDKVQDTLFALFERHQYYNIRDLVRETRQPVTYLKTILHDLCNYNTKYPHKNMWELKPEYRHYQTNTDEAKIKGGDASSDDE